MKDRYGRNITYMRISVTDRCNLRCQYCQPGEKTQAEAVCPAGMKHLAHEEILHYEEIVKIAKAACELGIVNFRLTGGEPLCRKGLDQLVRMLKNIPETGQVTITTNGTMLADQIDALADAGVDGINVSLDTMDPEKFREITGFNLFDRTMEGLRKALRYPKIRVHVNSVVEEDTIGEADFANADKTGTDRINTGNSSAPNAETAGWLPLIQLAKDQPLDVRFIEMMPIGQGKSYRPVDNHIVLGQMRKTYPDMQPDTSVHGHGPAVYYKIPGFQGSIGFISAVHGKFCDSCNRIRLLSEGQLKPCLASAETVETKEILRSGKDDAVIHELLKEAIVKTVMSKPDGHSFEKKEISGDGEPEKRNMSQIGG